jgi:hypothetical protein
MFMPVKEIHLEECHNVRDVLTQSRALIARADELTFWYSSVTDESLRLIPRANRLKVLAIHGSDVTDASIEHFARFRSLRELFILETRISERGAKELEAALPNCTIYWKGRPGSSK